MKAITASLVLAAAGLAVALPAQAQGMLSIQNSGDRNADKYQSVEERMRAQPLDWNVTRGTPGPSREERIKGPPGQSTGGLPAPGSAAEAEKAFPEEWKRLRQQQGFEGVDGESVDFGTKDVFTQYCENCAAQNLNWPQITIGKLFSNSGTCSASVISGNNIIVTAAHCCFNRSTGQWILGWSFVPAFRNGAAPFGTFPWTSARVLSRWRNVGDRRSDVCLITLGPNASKQNVTFYTGWLGRSWNWPTKQVHHALGYPGNIGGGNTKQLCVSESFNPNSTCGGQTVLNTGCSMTFGSSGGPWIRHYRNGNWVNSVVSGYDSDTCTGTFGSTFNGPRFTDSNIVTLCNAHGC